MLSRLQLLWFVLLYCMPGGSAIAQDSARVMQATRVDSGMEIDGLLKEPAWLADGHSTTFVQTAPDPGALSAQHSYIKILYDDNFVYIGAMLYDAHPDSILKQLTARDDFDYANTDAFTVLFDTYNDHQNGFSFTVTAAGVQADAKLRFDSYDFSWNAAWFSKRQITDSGWSVEMKIPYSAIRFPNVAEQLWGVNFLRTIRRNREKSAWNRVNPAVFNMLAQTGRLVGLKDIKAPIRLAFLPYLSAYVEDYEGNRAQTLNGGMDVKYGINEAFTLDLTLIPDFGQTLYDNKVLNLSPVEVRYDERRYFFTEGIDLFNKNDLFYSRRVGAIPGRFQTIAIDTDETIVKNPLTTKLYNASKISGRNKHNLGIGFFNAVSKPAYATVKNEVTGKERTVETSPLTNYNVLVLDQALPYNSYVTLVNTNVTRSHKFYDANVTALLTRLSNKSNTYAVDASADVSQQYFPANTNTGFRYTARLSKVKGNYTNYLSAQTISDRFNPNDLGYLARNNVSYYNFSQNYNIYKPFLWFNNSYNNLTLSYNRVYNPDDFQTFEISGSDNVTLRNFISLGWYWNTQPVTAKDYFEPRTPGRFYNLPTNFQYGLFVSSDYRKKFALDVEFSQQRFGPTQRHNHYLSVYPRYRFSDKLLVILGTEFYNSFHEVGFVDRLNTDVYLGSRNLYTNINTLTATYIFNSKMALKLNGRHYWSRAAYSKYSLLCADGSLKENGYTTNHNVNFNTFNIFTAFSWQFRPGSEMNVVYQNSIYTSSQQIFYSASDNISNVLNAPQSNSLSIKVIYFLDYISLKHGTF